MDNKKTRTKCVYEFKKYAMVMDCALAEMLRDRIRTRAHPYYYLHIVEVVQRFVRDVRYYIKRFVRIARVLLTRYGRQTLKSIWNRFSAWFVRTFSAPMPQELLYN